MPTACMHGCVCRRDEDASEVVLFSWNTERRQLCKLGLVTLPHHGNEAVMGWPLHLTAVPSSNTGSCTGLIADVV